MEMTVEMLRLAIAGKPAKAKVKLGTCTRQKDGEVTADKFVTNIHRVDSYSPEGADEHDSSQIETVVLMALDEDQDYTLT